MSVSAYIEAHNHKLCDCCGKVHATPVDEVIVGNGVIARIPEVMSRYGAKKAFVIADRNTQAAAGEAVCKILEEGGVAYTSFVFPQEILEPDEQAVGSVALHFDRSCDILIAVGSGVINDVTKILRSLVKLPFIIVGTAPSMDGYASDSSSMVRNGWKVSLYNGVANVVIGDLEILKKAPLDMVKSGIGDMLAKYIGICEWQIARIVKGEYYCPMIAELVRSSIQACVDNVDGLLKGEDEAISAVFEGLVGVGVAMSFAGSSRPASGVEHYLSHVWDMRGLAFGTPTASHGTQCAIATVITARLYERLRGYTPDREKALAAVASFDVEDWYRQLCTFMGAAGEGMVTLDRTSEKKYDPELHKERLEQILSHWDEIQKVVEEVPSAAYLEGILDRIEAPKTMAEIGIDPGILPLTLRASKDIRDKYVLSRLLWDLGLEDWMDME
ncbi:MAG: sn-glycerol-1-phosphate dehydrogenase [Oscillospiraceae bacterium]|nr:sn-glycerol-1-phosphate dehydrogenase [Oscillospiraceae bacterium]